MNYIELINQFWQTRRKVRLSSNEADLYYFLMQESNIRGWENPFECTNGLIVSTIGMTEKTMIEVRNRLQQKGLITFEAGQRKRKSPVYTLLYCNSVSKNNSIKVSINDSIKVSKTPNLYINKTETKTETIKEDTEDVKTPLVFPFTSDVFINAWNDLLKTPLWTKKLSFSLQKALDKLKAFDEEFVIELIDQAIVGGWNMLVDTNTHANYKKWLKSKTNDKKEPITRFSPPTVLEIADYCKERKNSINANVFYDFYQSKNWMVGSNKMKDWRACVRTWENKDKMKKAGFKQASNNEPLVATVDYGAKIEESIKIRQQELEYREKKKNSNRSLINPSDIEKQLTPEELKEVRETIKNL